MKTSLVIAVLAAITLAVACHADPALAQTKPIQLGLKGGVNLAELVFDPEIEEITLDRRLGIMGGGVLGFVISPGMTLDTDFLYIQKGAKWDEEFEILDEPIEVEVEAVYTYLVINPMLRFTVQNQGLRPYFMAGPEIGFLLDAKYEYSSGDVGLEEDGLKEATKDTDFGVNFGAGLEFPSGSTSIFFEGRYALGLTDIEEDEDDDEEDDEDDGFELKHRGIYLMAGIRF